MMLLVLTFPAGTCFFIWHRSHAAQTSKVIASFQADFQPEQPRQGWHYYWNENGPVGNANAYVELHWDNNHYVANEPVPPSGRYVQLSNRGGHPGHGPARQHVTGTYTARSPGVTPVAGAARKTAIGSTLNAVLAWGPCSNTPGTGPPDIRVRSSNCSSRSEKARYL